MRHALELGDETNPTAGSEDLDNDNIELETEEASASETSSSDGNSSTTADPAEPTLADALSELAEAQTEPVENLRVTGTGGDDLRQGGAGDDTVIGWGGADTLNGGSGKDVIYGCGHDDLLVGGSGNDVLNGGVGADTLLGGSGNDRLTTGDGDDEAEGGTGQDVLFGLGGADALYGGEGADRLHGGEDDDILRGGAGADILDGGEGADTIHGGADNDKLRGHVGDDVLAGEAGDDVAFGGTGRDLIDGGLGRDRLYGDAGDDTLIAGGGADLLDGGAGADALYGGAQNDKLRGSAGDDVLAGEGGDDVAFGGTGHDLLEGGAGHDRLFGDDGNDTLSASEGNDLLNGGQGADALYGGAQNDKLRGDLGNDFLHGESGHDVLFGGAGHDVLHGGLGNDRVYGDGGNDTLIAGGGDELLDGGTGADRFEVTAAALGAPGHLDIRGGAGHDVLVVTLDAGSAHVAAEFAEFTAGQRFVSSTLDLVVDGVEEIRFATGGGEGSSDAPILAARADRLVVDDKRMVDQPGITNPGSGREYVSIIEENFDYANMAEFVAALNDGTSGVWSTMGKNGSRGSNGPHSLNLDPRMRDADGELIGINPFSLEDGVLSISAGLIPDEKLEAVLHAVDLPYSNIELSDRLPNQQANDPNHEGGVDYYYGSSLNTNESWAESYGYFEMKATMPEGVGHFPAFWVTNASQGWPPEIDIIEAVGHTNQIVSTVIYNAYGQDEDFETAVYDLDFVNDRGLDFAHRNGNFDLDRYEAGRYANREGTAFEDYSVRTTRSGKVVDVSSNFEIAAKDANSGHYAFKTGYVVEEELYAAGLLDDLSANRGIMYSQDIVYAAEWTPDEIIWYIGLDSDNLIEVFRSETPEDNTTLQYVMANLEFGGSWPGYPTQDMYDEVFASTMDIDYIKVYALAPDNRIDAAPGEVFIYGEDQRQETVYLNDDGNPATPEHGEFRRDLFGNDEIFGNALDNVIDGGSGLDEFTGGAGADTFVVRGDQGNKIITDFDPTEGDSLLIDGFHIEGAAGALETLTQVGDDVWLIKGADPHNPQTIILRDITVGEIGADDITVIGSVSGGAQEDPEIFKNVDADGVVTGTHFSDRLKSKFGGYDGAAEKLVGGKGEDVYLLRSGETEIVERPNEGVDTIETNRNITLGENVENLVGLAAQRGQSLFGNRLDNVISGNVKGDLFVGEKGNDTLDLTLGGADVVRYGAGDGADVILGFGADDTVELSGIAFENFADLSSRLLDAARDTVLLLEDGEGILFRDTEKGDFTAQNFDFEVGENTLSGGADALDFLLF